MVKNWLVFLALVLPATALACPTAHQFYSLMSGPWMGQGQSFNMVNNQQWPVQVLTRSQVSGDHLQVWNHWREKRANSPLQYELSYFLYADEASCQDGQIAIYMKKGLQDPASLWVRGNFDGQLLVLNQELSEGYSLLSQTVFVSSGQTNNRLLFVRDHMIIQRTELSYQRQSAP